jgi:maltose O-acetyltransferase
VTVERHLEVLSGLIDTTGDVTIGRNVALANRVSLLTSGHEMDDPRARAGRRVLAPIVVGDGAWLGANVTVLGGVTIGEGAVVAAGSLVRADVPPHTLWAGVPARLVKALPVDRPAAPAQPADVVAQLA